MPDVGKIAEVTPILKGDSGDQCDFDIFRPISILPIISKISGHCVNLQTNDNLKPFIYYLISSLIWEKLFHKYLAQNMFDNISDVKFEGNIPAITYLCIKKDFDMFDHEIELIN